MKNYLFLPFSYLYKGLTSFYHYLYDKGIKKSHNSPIFSVSIGNLTVGGTGKTPFTIYLVNLFSDKKTAVLSRGYGRKTKGFIEANANSTSQEIGDEPKMIYQRFEGKEKVFVCENRLLGLNEIKEKYPDIEMVFLDDAHQHRNLNPSFKIVLSSFNQPFYEDLMLPAGRLRESKSGINRADALVITKVEPTLDKDALINLKAKITQKINFNLPIFFSKINFGDAVNIDGKSISDNTSKVLFSALANNENFKKSIEKKYPIERVYTFPDHHSYSKKEIENIINQNPNCSLICSEKDFVKVKEVFKNNCPKNIFYIPITFVLEDEKEFKEMILKKFESYQVNQN